VRRRLRSRLFRLTLRWRVAVTFGIGLLVISGLLAAVTWSLASDYMFRQRETSAIHQAEVNARLVENTLRFDVESLDDLLTGLTAETESSVLLGPPDDGWLIRGRHVEPQVLPEPLLAAARAGQPATHRLVVDGLPVLAVALPLDSGGTAFIQLFPLIQLERTLRYISVVLLAGVIASSLLAVGLGFWASRRALRPLAELTDAAARVAAGDLQARLPSHDDPDLEPLAATFNRTAEALEGRVRRDTRFAGDVSHELRSPLTTMANAAAVLERRRGELTGAAGRALDLLLSEVHRFQQMVVDLIEISREVDEFGAGDDAELVDLAALVRNVVEDRLDGQRPALELEEAAALVRGDRRRLDRVVTNLLENATRYGGGAVRVGVRHDDGCVRLEVDDAGPGVPAELRERIFERFARGVWAGRRGAGEGSGLGLALVAQHVGRHGGSAWVEDRPGGGARFVVELPEADQ
jgi:signal transduction histidine kinase